MFRITRELATLANTLPVSLSSSIFVRVDESRNDLLSVAIIGPEGTPYENGVFIFDCFFDQDYPLTPPRVHLKTTGGGTVRFNPNLYNSGKVCLSLLGTWSGPGWDPKHSTFLQVLISIQSLILVDHPYFNEPGYESLLGTTVGDQQSFDYNRTIAFNTLKFAILDSLRYPHNLFQAVIKKHFIMKSQRLRKQLKEWTEKYGSTSFQPFKAISEKIEDQLSDRVFEFYARKYDKNKAGKMLTKLNSLSEPGANQEMETSENFPQVIDGEEILEVQLIQPEISEHQHRKEEKIPELVELENQPGSVVEDKPIRRTVFDITTDTEVTEIVEIM